MTQIFKKKNPNYITCNKNMTKTDYKTSSKASHTIICTQFIKNKFLNSTVCHISFNIHNNFSQSIRNKPKKFHMQQKPFHQIWKFYLLTIKYIVNKVLKIFPLQLLSSLLFSIGLHNSRWRNNKINTTKIISLLPPT